MGFFSYKNWCTARLLPLASEIEIQKATIPFSTLQNHPPWRPKTTKLLLFSSSSKSFTFCFFPYKNPSGPHQRKQPLYFPNTYRNQLSTPQRCANRASARTGLQLPDLRVFLSHKNRIFYSWKDGVSTKNCLIGSVQDGFFEVDGFLDLYLGYSLKNNTRVQWLVTDDEVPQNTSSWDIYIYVDIYNMCVWVFFILQYIYIYR